MKKSERKISEGPVLQRERKYFGRIEGFLWGRDCFMGKQKIFLSPQKMGEETFRSRK